MSAFDQWLQQKHAGYHSQLAETKRLQGIAERNNLAFIIPVLEEIAGKLHGIGCQVEVEKSVGGSSLKVSLLGHSTPTVLCIQGHGRASIQEPGGGPWSGSIDTDSISAVRSYVEGILKDHWRH